MFNDFIIYIHTYVFMLNMLNSAYVINGYVLDFLIQARILKFMIAF